MIWVLLRPKKTFKGHSREHRMIKLNETLSLSEVKTYFGRFSVAWTKSFEGNKIPQRKQDCVDCKKELMCCECDVKRRMNCFNYEVVRVCKSCSHLVSQKKT